MKYYYYYWWNVRRLGRCQPGAGPGRHLYRTNDSRTGVRGHRHRGVGRWNPVGIAIAALLFGVANVSQFMFQAMDGRIPYQFFLMLPYMLAILALAGAVGRVTAPRELGR